MRNGLRNISERGFCEAIERNSDVGRSGNDVGVNRSSAKCLRYRRESRIDRNGK